MTAYHLVPLALLLMTAGSVMSYSESVKSRWWFPWAVVCVGTVNSLLWSVAARWTPDRRELYSVSAAWDVATITAYNVLPLVAMGVRLSPAAWVGFALVVTGAFLVKQG
jgi:uncharacterized membrane protein